jgi:hypothetical protein
LLAGAKRWENPIPPTTLAGLVAADVAWWADKVWFGPLLQTQALLAATDLITLLLLLVGGRSLRGRISTASILAHNKCMELSVFKGWRARRDSNFRPPGS